jgi:hypothetical protein
MITDTALIFLESLEEWKTIGFDSIMGCLYDSNCDLCDVEESMVSHHHCLTPGAKSTFPAEITPRLEYA